MIPSEPILHNAALYISVLSFSEQSIHSPTPFTICRLTIFVASIPCSIPVPCVPVAIAPAMV